MPLEAMSQQHKFESPPPLSFLFSLLFVELESLAGEKLEIVNPAFCAMFGYPPSSPFCPSCGPFFSELLRLVKISYRSTSEFFGRMWKACFFFPPPLFFSYFFSFLRLSSEDQELVTWTAPD